MRYEEPRTRPLEIAFMGYTSDLTRRFIRQFCEDNRESVRSVSERRVILTDDTRIIAVSPSMVRNRLDGYRFDQLILADDEREMIRDTYAHEIEIIIHGTMMLSCVPEEFQVLYYNPFAAEPCAECGRPGEVLHHRPGASPGVVLLCRECHERAHMTTAGEATVQGLVAGMNSASKAFIQIGVNADDAAAAFRRLSEATREIMSAEPEIALIRRNPNLSRFEKWILTRKLRRIEKKARKS